MEVVASEKEEVELKRQAILQRSEALAQESRLLHDNLDSLDERDKRLDSEMARLKNESNPILCLPNEITCYIFEMTRIQSESNYDHPHYELWPRKLEQRPEMTVSRVCQHWRQVALSYPSIWSHVVIRSWFSGQPLSIVQRLSVYLTRSQGAPLDIVVTIENPPYAREPVDCTDTLKEFLLAVLPHSTRWQRLVIWIAGKWNISPLSILEKMVVPQLEVFEIGSWPISSPHIPSAAPATFLTLFEFGAPKLASALTPAVLRLYHHCRSISTLYLQKGAWPQPWEQFVALMDLPNLTNLTLDSEGRIFMPPTINNVTTRIVAPNLRHFRLGCHTVLKHMWDTLSAPRLELLLLSDAWGLSIADTQSVFFPGGLFPALKTLALWSFEIAEPQDLLHLALATPQVTDLIICACSSGGTFMASLYEQSLAKNTNLWPHLQTFSYIVAYEYLFTGTGAPPAAYTYEYARKVLLRFVDWRLETFGCECAFWVDYPNHQDTDLRTTVQSDNPFLYVPEFDDSEEERALWQKYLIPLNRRVIPWPDEQTIHFGYHEKFRFGNASVRARDDLFDEL